MRSSLVALIAALWLAATASGQSVSRPALPPWADTTGEPGLYPNGDAVDVYRAALDLVYNEDGKRPSIIVLHDTAETTGDGPCPVKCDRVWPHKSKMDTTTILSFARLSPKRPRIRDFGYPIPIELVSYDDVEAMRNAGIGYLATHKAPSSLPGVDLAVEFQRRYPSAWGLATLTKVGFNDRHTEALVQVRHWCGEQCASTETLFLKRIENRWAVVERIPSYAEASTTRGNFRYRGPAGRSPTESELIYVGPPVSGRSDAVDAAAVYRAVLDSLYNFQGESPTTIVLTDRYFPANDALPPHKTRIDRDLLQKHAFLAGARSLPGVPIAYRKPIAVLTADSLDALDRAGAALAQQLYISQPMWLAFRKRFPGAWGMVGLSRVAFDAAHQQALVYSDHQCGYECGNSDTWVLARNGERWRVVERLQRARPTQWDPDFFPLRYVGMDAKPNSYRPRNVSGLFVNAVTKRPIAFTPVVLRGFGIPSRVLTTDSGGRIRLGRVPLTGGVEMKVGCPKELSADSISFPGVVFTPGLDTTVVTRIDFRNCLSPLPWVRLPRTLTGANAFIGDTAARFVFPRRGPTYRWDLPLKGMHPGESEYMWQVRWRASGEHLPFMLWLRTDWKAGGPRQGLLTQLIAGQPLEVMILGGDFMFADPQTDRKNVFASVEDGQLVFIIRGREAVRRVFPAIPAAVNFETIARQVPMPEYGPGDSGEGQNVVVNCRSSDSTGAARRRCDVPSETQRRQQLAHSSTPREVRVVAVSYDGGTIMHNVEVRIRSEDLKSPQLTKSTGNTGTFRLSRLPYDSLSFEALCAGNGNGQRRVSGNLALYLAPGNDTTVQLLVDPLRCH